MEGRGATIAQSGEDATVPSPSCPVRMPISASRPRCGTSRMPGAQIAALPYSSVVGCPTPQSMVSGMTDLSDAVGALAEGTSSLASGRRRADRRRTGSVVGRCGVRSGVEQAQRLVRPVGERVEARSTLRCRPSRAVCRVLICRSSTSWGQLPGRLNALSRTGLRSCVNRSFASSRATRRRSGARGPSEAFPPAR